MHAVSAAGSFALLVGCEWLRPDSCDQTTTRCDGDRVQSCVPDPQSSAGAAEPVNHWVTDKTCADDPQLGAYRCGVVEGRATCVPESPTGEASSEPEPETSATTTPWIRVRVSHSERGTRINEIEPFLLDSAHLPGDSAWGSIAAVSSRGGEVVDATLVPLEADQEASFVWLSGDGIDQVELLDEHGQSLSRVDYTASVSEPPSPPDHDIRGALARQTVRMIARVGRTQVQTTDRMRQLAGQALARVPETLLLLAPSVVLELDSDSLRALSPPVLADAGARSDDVVPPNPFVSTGKLPRAAWIANRQELLLDFRSEALEEYATNTLALTRDIVRALAGTFVHYTEVVTEHVQSPLPRKLPHDFPAELGPYLVDQYAQLLVAGESPVSAWHGLHRIAVSAELASPYSEDFGFRPSTEADAVRAGVASIAGAASASADLTDYIALAAVPESWTDGPCASLRAAPLDEVAPPLLVHAAKLIALRGLGLLEAEALSACVGELRPTAGKDPKLRDGSIVAHKRNGERIAFTEELEGIRQPYFSDEVQLSWKAQRAYLSASLSVGYRGRRPIVMRLQPVAGHQGKDFRSGEDHGAVLAFANPDGYRTSIAEAGLVVVTDVSEHALNAYALMVSLSEPVAGTKVFPLVSAQVVNPSWGAAP